MSCLEEVFMKGSAFSARVERRAVFETADRTVGLFGCGSFVGDAGRTILDGDAGRTILYGEDDLIIFAGDGDRVITSRACGRKTELLPADFETPFEVAGEDALDWVLLRADPLTLARTTNGGEGAIDEAAEAELLAGYPTTLAEEGFAVIWCINRVKYVHITQTSILTLRLGGSIAVQNNDKAD
ncbi:hypothetical protein M422DRAFT_242064 [Sphaerobolus stellatus SS14]|nr:hypothetical protein M422DRAFT_242064 [Sphaerobolus stellatus SS14]